MSGELVYDFGSTTSHTSVLTERPAHERLSPAEHDLYLIWLVTGVIVITGTTLWLIFRDGPRKKLAPAPASEPGHTTRSRKGSRC